MTIAGKSSDLVYETRIQRNVSLRKIGNLCGRGHTNVAFPSRVPFKEYGKVNDTEQLLSVSNVKHSGRKKEEGHDEYRTGTTVRLKQHCDLFPLLSVWKIADSKPRNSTLSCSEQSRHGCPSCHKGSQLAEVSRQTTD